MQKNLLLSIFSHKIILIVFFVTMGLLGLSEQAVENLYLPSADSTMEFVRHPLERGVIDFTQLLFSTLPFAIALLLYLEKKLGWILGASLITLFILMYIPSVFNDALHLPAFLCLLYIAKITYSAYIRQLYTISSTRNAVLWTGFGIFLVLFFLIGTGFLTSLFVYNVLKYYPYQNI